MPIGSAVNLVNVSMYFTQICLLLIMAADVKYCVIQICLGYEKISVFNQLSMAVDEFWSMTQSFPSNSKTKK